MPEEDPTLFAVISSDENGDNGFGVLTGFSDADYARSFAEQHKSTSGYAFFVFGNWFTGSRSCSRSPMAQHMRQSCSL
jgi:hypothetical protein